MVHDRVCSSIGEMVPASGRRDDGPVADARHESLVGLALAKALIPGFWVALGLEKSWRCFREVQEI